MLSSVHLMCACFARATPTTLSVSSCNEYKKYATIDYVLQCS